MDNIDFIKGIIKSLVLSNNLKLFGKYINKFNFVEALTKAIRFNKPYKITYIFK